MPGLILLTLVALAQETVEVVVAAHDLEPGRPIHAQDVQTIELPPAYIPNAVLREPDQAIGRVPRERVLKHEFIRQERLADPNSGLGAQVLVPRGMRLFDLTLPEVRSWPLPGDRIDLVRTTGEPCAVAAAVPVLAVRRSPDGQVLARRSTEGVEVIYLALSPAQVGAVLGTDQPKILLRDPADLERVLPACED